MAAFIALIHKHRPDLVPNPTTLNTANALANLTLAFDVATKLGIPQLLDPEDMLIGSQPEQFSVITYLSYWYDMFAKAPTAASAPASPAVEPVRPAPAPVSAPVSPTSHTTPTKQTAVVAPPKVEKPVESATKPAAAVPAEPKPAKPAETLKVSTSTTSTSASKPKVQEPVKPTPTTSVATKVEEPKKVEPAKAAPKVEEKKEPVIVTKPIVKETAPKEEAKPKPEPKPAAVEPKPENKPEPAKPEPKVEPKPVTQKPVEPVLKAKEPMKEIKPVEPAPKAKEPVKEEIKPDTTQPSTSIPSVKPVAAAKVEPTPATAAKPKQPRPTLPKWQALSSEQILSFACDKLPLLSLFRMSMISKKWRSAVWKNLKILDLCDPIFQEEDLFQRQVFNLGPQAAVIWRNSSHNISTSSIKELQVSSFSRSLEPAIKHLTALTRIYALTCFDAQKDEITKLETLFNNIVSASAKNITSLALSSDVISAASIQSTLKRVASTLTELELRYDKEEDFSDSFSSLTHLQHLSLHLIPSNESGESESFDLQVIKSLPPSLKSLRLRGKVTERILRQLRSHGSPLESVELDYEFWNGKFCTVRAKDISAQKIKEIVAENLPQATVSAAAASPAVVFAALESAGLRNAPKVIADAKGWLCPSHSFASLMLFKFGPKAWKQVTELFEANPKTLHIEDRDSQGRNAFHYVTSRAFQDYFILEKLLLDEVLDAAMKRDRLCLLDGQRRNPLMLASYDDDSTNVDENLALFKTIAHRLIQSQFVNINDKDAFGETVLHHVVRGSSSETLGVKLSILAALGIDWNAVNTAGQCATHMTNIDALQEILWAKSPEVSETLDLNWPFKNGLLFRACAENLLSVVSLLLLPQFSSWIDWNCTIPENFNYKRNSAHFDAQSPHHWLKKYCVEPGETFLQIACENASAAVIRLLLGAFKSGEKSVTEFYSSCQPDRAPLFLACTAARRRAKLVVPEGFDSHNFVYEANDIRKICLLIENGFTADNELVFPALVGADGDVTKCRMQPELDAATVHRTLQILILNQLDSKLIEFFIHFASLDAVTLVDEADGSKSLLHQLLQASAPSPRVDEVAKYLLLKGVSAIKPDAAGVTPLAVASQFKHSAAIIASIQEAAKIQHSQLPQQSGGCVVM